MATSTAQFAITMNHLATDRLIKARLANEDVATYFERARNHAAHDLERLAAGESLGLVLPFSALSSGIVR